MKTTTYMYDSIFSLDHHPDFSPDLPAWVTHSLPPVPSDQVMMSLVWAALQAH